MGDEKTVTIKIYLDESLRAEFKSACALKRLSMNQVIVEFIEGWLKENSTEEKQEK
jgi:hypothetical protein